MHHKILKRIKKSKRGLTLKNFLRLKSEREICLVVVKKFPSTFKISWFSWKLKVKLMFFEHPDMPEMKKRPYNTLWKQLKKKKSHVKNTPKWRCKLTFIDYNFMLVRCVVRGKVKFNRSGTMRSRHTFISARNVQVTP